MRQQSVQPDLILGVNNDSSDGSQDLMLQSGAKVVAWSAPYHHARVLNHALRSCQTDLVLVLSSHTLLRSPTAIEQLVRALDDPQTACASGKWDDDPFYSEAVNWAELKAKGIKFVSIYSNSFGMLRRRLWEGCPFDESLPTMEDYAWALEQVKRGYTCRRVKFDFKYARSGPTRYGVFAALTFRLAARHGLRVVWLGPRASVQEWLKCVLSKRTADGEDGLRLHSERIWAWLAWRWRNLTRE